jgi:hypothetical protein
MEILVILFFVVLVILGTKVIFFNKNKKKSNKSNKSNKSGGTTAPFEDGKPSPPEDEKLKENN